MSALSVTLSILLPSKAGWMANTLAFKGKSFPLVHLESRTYFPSLMHAHTERKHTQCEQGISVCAPLDTNKYAVDGASAQAATGRFLSLCLWDQQAAVKGNFRGLYMR